jgi:hypothetical protein
MKETNKSKRIKEECKCKKKKKKTTGETKEEMLKY